ncbi:fibrillarin-like rRNA/tRNA 2'-O-methyltransferase [Candidatus Marsarchaeota archaeon]|jgi:Fibrillarin-like rRNA methylase|nr:fibrillarin-like rRNA/tRNA 2'-O-methyltransferase [Candidatus Marsarchaeota archaeon]MCL5092656.1 fibrillarin-like rRNA/tRNA 2'-O-methyltransferase [Candidatus Marsarchaeota archaeon]
MIKMIFPGVFSIDGRVATINLAKGRKVYGEETRVEDGIEYRLWNPYRSKLSAALLNGLSAMHIKEGSKVLYLGAATGTTSSHVSDIVGDSGIVYCIELSERNMRELINVCDARSNMLPILGDARNTDGYKEYIEECDVLYQDVSAREQSEILKANSRFLKKGGFAYFIIKSQSVDVGKKPADVFDSELKNLSGVFDIVEKVHLEPYDELHLFVALKKR